MNHCQPPQLGRATSAPSNPQRAVPLGTRTPFSQVPPPGPSADLRAFFSSCSSQSLLSRGAGGAWVTSLPHGPGFPCGSLGKRQTDSSLTPVPVSLRSPRGTPQDPFLSAPGLS